jgi:S1-C subfamily serine protease
MLTILLMITESTGAFAFFGLTVNSRAMLGDSRHSTLVHSSSWYPMQPSGPHKSKSTLHSVPTDIGIQIARRVQPSVALVTPIGVRNSTARGSGFVIDLPYVECGDNNNSNDSNYIYLLTAAHVASPGTRIEISFSGNNSNPNRRRRRPATVIGRNITLDLALIRADRFPEDPVSLLISPTTPEVGSLAFAHGYPASRMRGPAMTCGIVCGIADGLGMPDEYLVNNGGIHATTTDSNDTTSFVVTDAAMSGGMSGGPLVDMEGTVLGVNALIRPDLRALGNYAVSADEIRSFVQTVSLTNTKQPSEDSSTTTTSSGYRVILFNDRMNKRTRVAQVLREVAMLKEGEAQKVMMDAHTTGRGLVKQFAVRQNADELCQSLQNEDILVEVE